MGVVTRVTGDVFAAVFTARVRRIKRFTIHIENHNMPPCLRLSVTHLPS
jgi:hypothetical protein